MDSLKEININRYLKRDVEGVVGSIYKLNAPYAKGYLFNPVGNYREIARGMYCNFDSEINFDYWTYYYDLKTKKYFKIVR